MSAARSSSTRALIYIGSTYGERLPTELLDDILQTSRAVLWLNDNILQLQERAGDFAARYGWRLPGSTTRPSPRCATRAGR